jgi:ABC-type sugar transport system substrate-binding protein
MLATAAKLSRALAATFGVLLSKLALGVQPGSFASGTHYPLLASAESAANGFWQIVSITLNAAPRQTGNCQKFKIQTSKAAEQSAAFFLFAAHVWQLAGESPVPT